jgi:hypothetical protein
MGVLEDAIREHLELKRQHGASEEEVVQQETEALGQARREAPPPEAEPEALDAEAPEAELAEPGPLDVEAPEAELAEPGPLDAGPPEPDLAEPPPESPGEAAAGAASLAEPPPPPFDHGPEEAPPEGSEREPQPVERDETAMLEEPLGFDELEPGVAPPMPAREEDEPVDAAEDEDVLEETPEFLQETPEHDRLWFEQKPPRDFDFD